MSTTDSPLHIVSVVVIRCVCALMWKLQAHQHAANAEDFLNEGLLIPAAAEHAKAAKAFLQCEEKSNDSNVLFPLGYPMSPCRSVSSFDHRRNVLSVCFTTSTSKLAEISSGGSPSYGKRTKIPLFHRRCLSLKCVPNTAPQPQVADPILLTQLHHPLCLQALLCD